MVDKWNKASDIYDCEQTITSLRNKKSCMAGKEMQVMGPQKFTTSVYAV